MTPITLPAEAWHEVEEGTEALIERWLVNEGEEVEAGQSLAEVVLAKTDFEITAPMSGRIDKILVSEQETFPLGAVLAFLNESGVADTLPAGDSGSTTLQAVETIATATSSGPRSESSNTQIIPLTGMRGSVARNMASSWQTVPRVTLLAEVDVSACEERRTQLRNQNGSLRPPSITHFILRAVALTLREYPRLNAHVTSAGVELASEVHIGLAVNVEEGILVPVIRNADQKQTLELAAEARDLADAARSKGLRAADFQGATFTVTSLGSTRVEWFTPLVNVPQVAILGIGLTQKRPVVRGDRIIAAPTTRLSLVFDHRALDGYPTGQFLTTLSQKLEKAEEL